MKKSTPEQSILAFLDRKTVPAEGKAGASMFDLYYRYTKHMMITPPYKTVSAKEFFRILQELGFRQRRIGGRAVYDGIELSTTK